MIQILVNLLVSDGVSTFRLITNLAHRGIEWVPMAADGS